jgi:hypothetical protein
MERTISSGGKMEMRLPTVVLNIEAVFIAPSEVLSRIAVKRLLAVWIPKGISRPLSSRVIKPNWNSPRKVDSESVLTIRQKNDRRSL